MDNLAKGFPACEEGPGDPDPDFSEIITRLKTLPSYHPTVVSLLAISTESPSAVEQFEAVFQKDPAFAAELLQCANSAAFGLRGNISSIKHALMLLGLEYVTSLALNLSMRFYWNRAPSMRDVHAVWSHSVATAIAAQALADACGQKSAGTYTAGLVHDIGRLGLLMTEGERYIRFCKQDFSNVEQYLDQEFEALAVTHPKAGGVLADSWGFPKQLGDCIRNHHEPPRLPLSDCISLVASGCRLAAALGYPEVVYQQTETYDDFLEGLPKEVRGRSCLESRRLRSTITTALHGAWGFAR